MIFTTLPNQYENYWSFKKRDWHTLEIGTYHVSTIGCDHSNLKPEDHAGPCLRETFYKYTKKFVEPEVKKQSTITKGTLELGTILHKKLQKIARKNDNFTLDEFPLQRLFQDQNGTKIICRGSADLIKFVELGLNNEVDKPLVLITKDAKSSSEYTFPRNDDDRNITHFDQLRIYTYWLQTYYFNPKYVKLGNDVMVYVNKRDLYTGEQLEAYESELSAQKFVEFVQRSFKLHYALQKFFEIWEKLPYKNSKEMTQENRIKLSECLPDKEPHQWCQFCHERHKCRDNVLFKEDIKQYSDAEIVELYRRERGKDPIWRGRETKEFQSFRNQFKIEEEEVEEVSEN